MSETKHEIPAAMLDAATKAIARHHGWTQINSVGAEHSATTNYSSQWLAYWRPTAKIALEAVWNLEKLGC